VAIFPGFAVFYLILRLLRHLYVMFDYILLLPNLFHNISIEHSIKYFQNPTYQYDIYKIFYFFIYFVHQFIFYYMHYLCIFFVISFVFVVFVLILFLDLMLLNYFNVSIILNLIIEFFKIFQFLKLANLL